MEHRLSVRGIRKHTLFAEDVEEWAITSKNTPVEPVPTQLPGLANVYSYLYVDGWSQKVQQRKGTGTGRMRYMKTIPRIFKNKIKGLAKWSIFKHILIKSHYKSLFPIYIHLLYHSSRKNSSNTLPLFYTTTFFSIDSLHSFDSSSLFHPLYDYSSMKNSFKTFYSPTLFFLKSLSFLRSFFFSSFENLRSLRLMV